MFGIRGSIFDIRLAALLALLLLPHCTRPRFPVVPPVERPSRELVARSRAQSHFIKALDFDRRGLTQLADRYFQSAYALDPSSVTLRDILVQRYVNSGRYREAVVLVRKDRKNQQLSVDDRRLLAKIYLKMGQYENAASLIEALPDKSDEEIFALALIYEARGSIDKAFTAYREYLRRKPQSIEVGLKIGLMLIKSKRFPQAESLLVEMSQHLPPDSQQASSARSAIFDALGICKLSAGDTALAINFFETALLADSLNEDALRNAAQIHLQKGDLARATPYFERISALKPYEAKTLVPLYYYTGQHDKARDLARRLLETDVNDIDLHFYLGQIAYEQNDTTLAALELEKALALQPTSERAWRTLCNLFVKQRKLDDALLVAQRYTDELPENSESWRTLGWVYSVRKEYGKATKFLRRAVALDSTDHAAWFELGSALERRSLIDSAAIAFRRVLALNPGDAQAANYLGYMWAEKGIRLDSALALLKMALAEEPDNYAYLDSYAWIWYQKGNYDQALTFMRKALDHIKDGKGDAVLLEHYGDILVKKGDLPGALDAYEKSLKLESDDPKRVTGKIEDVKKNLGL